MQFNQDCITFQWNADILMLKSTHVLQRNCLVLCLCTNISVGFTNLAAVVDKKEPLRFIKAKRVLGLFVFEESYRPISHS